MNAAAALLEAAFRAGWQVRLVAGRLMCRMPEAEEGGSLLQQLRAHKVDLLALLSAQGSVSDARLACTDPSDQTAEEHSDAPEDDRWEEGSDPVVTEPIAHAVTDHPLGEGQPPPHWTQARECAGCGPVFLWPGSPARVSGCPWCRNRGEGRPIPRPVAVTCGTCRHFRRIEHAHLGHCAVGEPEAIAGLWDTDRRGCPRWLPLEQNTGAESHGE